MLCDVQTLETWALGTAPTASRWAATAWGTLRVSDLFLSPLHAGLPVRWLLHADILQHAANIAPSMLAQLPASWSSLLGLTAAS